MLPSAMHKVPRPCCGKSGCMLSHLRIRYKSEPFAPSSLDLMQAPSASAYVCEWHCTESVASDVSALLVQESERLSTEEMTAAAMEVLRRLFGDSIPEPTASIATKWGSDAYARGKPLSLIQGCNPPLCSTCENSLIGAVGLL